MAENAVVEVEAKRQPKKAPKKDGRSGSSAANLKKARAAREAKAVQRMSDKLEAKRSAMVAKRDARPDSDDESEDENTKNGDKEESSLDEEYSEEEPLEELKLVRARAPKKERSQRIKPEPKPPKERVPTRAEKQIMTADMIGDAIAHALAKRKPAAPKKARMKNTKNDKSILNDTPVAVTAEPPKRFSMIRM